MSDFIPPLISSSPPPMPDFDDDDDDEEEDDVEFGLGISSGIGDDLDFSVPGDGDSEKKDKILEIQNRRLEINGTANNWKCEEQDSTSQDSGLCMASQSSEGMSPLPQSDDEEKCNHDNDNNSVNMKHSSTVLFNPDDTHGNKNNGTRGYSDNIAKGGDKTDEMLPTDTGQDNHNNLDQNKDLEVFNDEGEKINLSDTDSESEFVWGNTTNNDDLFQNSPSHQNSDDRDCAKTVSTIPVDVENEEVFNKLCDNTNSFNKNVFNVSEENTVLKDSLNVLSCNSVTDQCSAVDPKFVKDTDTNICDNVNSIKTSTSIDENDDDFGNFASVTIPNCDSLSHKTIDEHPSSLPDISGSPHDLSNQQINESSIIYNESDLEFKFNSIENNVICVASETTSSEIKEKSHEVDNDCDNLNFNQTCEDSSESNFKSRGDINNDCNGSGDDDFDDFSDFTQSSDLPIASFQPVDIIHKSDQSTIKEISSKSNLEEVFPKSDDTVSLDVQTNNLETGPVWKHLCPLENSPALTFQWSNSRAHNKLLAALSIDSRNILFGPHWNANIPRFAANLGTNPLQPVKAIESQSGSSASPIPPTSEEAAVVPDAHFDWVGSGLTNPLDYVSNKARNDFEELNGSCKSSTVTVDNLNILSNEAESIISLLPDLNFMRKTYIEILISKG